MGNQHAEVRALQSRRDLLTKAASLLRPSADMTATPLQQAADQALAEIMPRKPATRRLVGAAVAATTILAGCDIEERYTDGEVRATVEADRRRRGDDDLIVIEATGTDFTAPVVPTAEPTRETIIDEPDDQEIIVFSEDNAQQDAAHLGISLGQMTYVANGGILVHGPATVSVYENMCGDITLSRKAEIDAPTDPRGSIAKIDVQRHLFTGDGTVSIPDGRISTFYNNWTPWADNCPVYPGS